MMADPNEAFVRFCRHLTVIIACVALAMVYALVSMAFAAEIPRDAVRYQRTLVREARAVWGVDAPVATFAGQIHQESAWRAAAESPVGAVGLAQFMPGTVTWISGAYPATLGAGEPYNPVWAIRALVTYDLWLWQRVPRPGLMCLRMWAVLRGYNGGLGYLGKESRAAQSTDPRVYEVACPRFRSEASCRENTEYPRRILLKHEPRYETWGPGSC